MKVVNPQLESLLQGLYELIEGWQDESNDPEDKDMSGSIVYLVCANDLESLIQEFKEEISED